MDKLLRCAIVFFFINYAFAQQDSVEATQGPCHTVILTNAAYVVSSLVFHVVVHEMGHVGIASLGGAEDVRWGFYRKTANETYYGWTNWKAGSMTPFGDAAAGLGGVLLTRTWAEASDYMSSNVLLPGSIQRFVSMTFVLGHFDFARYILMDAVRNLYGTSGYDIDDFVTYIAGRNTVYRTLTYATLLAIAGLDLVADWDRIARHWKVLGGEPYCDSLVRSGARLTFGPYLATDALGLRVGVNW